MESSHLDLCGKFVPSSYINQAQQSRQSRSNLLSHLLEQSKLPEEGFREDMIEMFLSELSAMDSNNDLSTCGAGEREGRIYSSLVARRHFRFAHGVGRSGDVTAVQPKAAGSSILNQLCSKLMLDVIRLSGIRAASSCIVVPMATGMSLMLCFLALRSLRPKAKYIIWPRIDQKSCFKAMISAGYQPLIVENLLEGDELRTDVEAIKKIIGDHDSEEILCVHTTTSCFAPRVPDRLEEISAMCKEHDIPHIVNNAYGVQLSKCMHLIQQAARVGRVDAFIQSCDKNFMVPVGGALVATCGADNFLEKVASTYAGRAASTPAIDLTITMLQLGAGGWKKLLKERKDNYLYLQKEMRKLAEKYNEKLLETPHNPISMVMSLSTLGGDSKMATEFGSMLFSRKMSGARVVAQGTKKTIEGHSFHGYGSHSDAYPHPYLTVAAGIGMQREECDLVVKRIDKTMKEIIKRIKKQKKDTETSNDQLTDSVDIERLHIGEEMSDSAEKSENGQS